MTLKLMKAMIWTDYGPPEILKLREVEKPTPKANEVLINVRATTVLSADCQIRGLDIPLILQLPVRLLLGFRKPTRFRMLGQELAGEIDEVGEAVTRFKKGDAVFAAVLLRLGTTAEYVCLPETYPVLKPANMTYDEAATIPTGGIYGLHLVQQAAIQAGQKLLINGAGGSIGSYAIQLAKYYGADVTCVDSTEKLETMRATGADQVIDYTQTDFTKMGQMYDAIIDVVGKSSFSRSLRCLKPGGRYVLENSSPLTKLRANWVSTTTDKQVIPENAEHTTKAYAYLKELIEAGKLRSIIDRRYPLEQLAEAHRYVEGGHKKGHVVVTVP